MASGGRLLGAAGNSGTGGGLEKILRVNIGSPSDVTSKCTSLKEICLRVHQSGPFLGAKLKVKNCFVALC